MNVNQPIMRERELYNILYKMGLIETFCFATTDDKNWWFIGNDLLLHMHGWSPAGYKIISSNLMGLNKYI